jgi:hypothetical protein
MNQECEENMIYPRAIKVLQYHRLISNDVKGSVDKTGLPATELRRQFKTPDAVASQRSPLGTISCV